MLISISKLYALRYTIRVDCKIRETDLGGRLLSDNHILRGQVYCQFG